MKHRLNGAKKIILFALLSIIMLILLVAFIFTIFGSIWVLLGSINIK